MRRLFIAALSAAALAGAPPRAGAITMGNDTEPQHSPTASTAEASRPTLVLIEARDEPVLTVHSPGADDNKYGFEGGRALKVGSAYHLFTSEMVGDPFWVTMRLAHWTSVDGVQWRRVSTLFESSGDYSGTDPRAALWSPMPIYDERDGRWNLFYVAYRAAPSTDTQWRENHHGVIWRAVSAARGHEGIGGPYEDAGIILSPGPHSDTWEGLQGTDSFFPYRVGDGWCALYGSARTERLPIQAWQVGLAEAPELAGPWRRRSELNPLAIEPVFIENPIVHRLADGTYVAVYASGAPNTIGYTSSVDGMHWSPGRALIVQPKGVGVWADDVRTPLGLIAEEDGTFTLFYTGYHRRATLPGTPAADASALGTSVSSVGVVRLRIEAMPP